MRRGRIRVLIVDDHDMVREGLRLLLSREETLDVVGEAATGREALEMLPQTRPDVVLMDLAMPVMDGAEATARICAEYPKVRVVVLSGAGDAALAKAALDAGAVCYLLKDSCHAGVTRAVREAGEGLTPGGGGAQPLLVGRLSARPDVA